MRSCNSLALAGCLGLAVGLAAPRASAQAPDNAPAAKAAQPAPAAGWFEYQESPLPAADYLRFVTTRDAWNGDPNQATGLQLVPLDAAARVQLKLPEGRGLVVAGAPFHGPAAAGVQKDDILLTLDDAPIAKAQDLEARLKASGDKPLVLVLLRKGKPVSLTVQPRILATFGPVEPKPPAYWIGVSVAPAPPVLKAQLGLDANGLIATDVIKGGPAEKAGVAVHDILMKVNDKPVGDQSALVDLVQKNAGKPVRLAIVRGGERKEIELTPEPRKDDVDHDNRADVLFQAVVAGRPGVVWQQGEQNGSWVADLLPYVQPSGINGNLTYALTQPYTGAQTIDPRVDALVAEVKELHKAVEELTRAVKDRK
ncbi:Putative zinc metalloprotease [Aquisphaera giovannonii]|uniref:Zinc metalloprotease n=1 Tax=Aquisphaera giovannonii TaxID=406548 RepID=A0A5B9WFT8_9BACT|nr:PDZ domain-containing protein [Aquisphaera giovannonii]QEH38875.1 Putative zinc metalloprotease [Aquisphaera giovannonii]